MGYHDTSILPSYGIPAASTVQTKSLYNDNLLQESGDAWVRGFLSRFKNWPTSLSGTRPGSPSPYHINRAAAPTLNSDGTTTPAQYEIYDPNSSGWVDITYDVMARGLVWYGQSVVGSLIATAVAAEATTRAANDSTLSTNLAAEITARTAADTTLNTAITTEATARSSADSALTTAINAEVTRAQAAEATLTTNLAAEVTARTNAITTINATLAGLGGGGGGSTYLDPDTGIAVYNTLPGAVTADQIIFNRADGKLYKGVGGVWVEAVAYTGVAVTVADGSITTAKFASGIAPVEIWSSLPTSGNYKGRTGYLTTDDKIYRHNGTSFITGINGSDLTGTIGASQLAANSVIAGKVAAAAIGTTELAAGAITTAKIAAGAVTAATIAANSVYAGALQADSVSTAAIQANAITAGKIQAGVIGATHLTATAIDGMTITGSTVRTASGSTRVEMAGGSNDLKVYISGSVVAQFGGTIANGLLEINGASSSYYPAFFNNSSSSGGAAKFTSTGGYTLECSQTSNTAGYYAGVMRNTGGGFGAIGASSGSGSKAFNAVSGGYAPFTGCHDAFLLKTDNPVPGDIMVDGEIVHVASVMDTISKVSTTTTPNMHAIGVFVNRYPMDPAGANCPPAMTGDDDVTPIEAWTSLVATHDLCGVASLGEGAINVCGRGGNLAAGDLIVTSTMAGKGQKQADDVVKSYTVARARQAVTFDSPDQVKLVSCIFLCG